METKKPETKKDKGGVIGCLVIFIFIAFLCVGIVSDSIADINADNEFVENCRDYANSTASLNGEVIFGSSRTKPDLCRILNANGQVLEYTRQELSALRGS